MNDKNRTNKISFLSLGIAIGFAEGLYMMLFAWLGWVSGFGVPLIHTLATVMYGYAPSFMGGIMGGILGFIDGFIFGIIVAFVYNLVTSHSCNKSSIE